MKEKPIRIQRKRVKNFNLQAESMARNGLPCVYVGRPSKFGNPWKVGQDFKMPHCQSVKITVEGAVKLFKYWLGNRVEESPNFLDELRGKNLACFCKEGEPCHADILLEMANKQL